MTLEIHQLMGAFVKRQALRKTVIHDAEITLPLVSPGITRLYTNTVGFGL
jgi:hypothetical protein